MKLLIAIVSALACISFGYSWYQGISVPAWQPLIWCFIVFISDLEKYLESQ